MKTLMIAETEVHLETAESYLQVNDAAEKNIGTIWEYLCKCYRGFEAFFCFHGSSVPTDYLEGIGAKLVDDCLNMSLSSAGFTHKELPSFVPVTEENFAAFAEFHDQRNPDMYWTSARLREEKRWCILLDLSEAGINGYIMMSMWNPQQAEIFKVEATEQEQCEGLIAAAVAQAFAVGKSEVLYMPDVGTREQVTAATLGFRSIGSYQGYRVRIPLEQISET